MSTDPYISAIFVDIAWAIIYDRKKTIYINWRLIPASVLESCISVILAVNDLSQNIT